ncbi:hypothetical protein QJS66_10730 [Kocuria rhizophila]|nr:hypothetical protein QJS66_10730 [Kocuria rhizophila]
MTAPLMRAYTDLLVDAPQARGLRDGRTAAFIPPARTRRSTGPRSRRSATTRPARPEDGFDGRGRPTRTLVPVPGGLRRRSARSRQPGGPPAPRGGRDRRDAAGRRSAVTSAPRRSSTPTCTWPSATWRCGCPAAARWPQPHGGRRHRGYFLLQIWQQIKNGVSCTDTGNTAHAPARLHHWTRQLEVLRGEIDQENYEKWSRPAASSSRTWRAQGGLPGLPHAVRLRPHGRQQDTGAPGRHLGPPP